MLMGERVGRRCQQLHFGVVTEVPTRHGGKRKGAGRKRVLRFEQQPHRSRPWLSSRTPIHIVMRLSKVVGRLRRRRAYHAIRWALIKTLERRNFRVVHISIQDGHIHALCEADDRVALANGVRGFSISAARRLNAAIAADLGLPKARVGQVFIDRYHATQIRSPRQARNALAYVLNNWRKHREDRAAFMQRPRIDRYSSAVWFVDWAELDGGLFSWPKGYEPLPVARPRTWLLARGWKRGGPPVLSMTYVPGPQDRP
jgi:REP element-mobilizing transposase RayT